MLITSTVNIYIYYDHVKLQRHRWLYIGHIHPKPTGEYIYIYLPEVSIYILIQVNIIYSPGMSRDTLLCHDYGLTACHGRANDAHASMTNHPDDSG